MNMPLVLLNRRRRGGSFSPYSLFSGTAIGTWFDPSDLTTMYQDAAGTTAVTTPGQPVGLRLDKSKGLVLGAELVTNGTFPVDTAGPTVTEWTATRGATLSVVSNALRVTQGAVSDYALASQAVSLTVGAWYRLTLNYLGGTASNVQVGIGVNNTSADGTVVATSSSAQSITLNFLATAATMYVRASVNVSTDNVYADFDNFSLKALPGNHATQSVLASRPVYGIEPAGGRRNLLLQTEGFGDVVWANNLFGAWTNATVTANTDVAPDGTLTADTISLTTSVRNRMQVISVTPNASYTFSLYVKGQAANTYGSGIYLRAATGLNGALVSLGHATTRVDTTLSDSVYTRFSVSFTVPSSGVNQISVGLTGSGDAPSPTANIYTWGAQLETGSTATAYQRVLSAYDVTESGVATCHYVQYDGSDDSLSTSAIDFTGTDKMSVFAGVRKLSDAATAMIVESSTDAGSNNGAFRFLVPGVAGYEYRQRGTLNAAGAAVSSGYASPISNVLTGLGDIGGDTATLRINGTQVAQSTADQGTGNYGNYPLFIGRRGGASLPFNGRDYGLIVVGKAASAGEITDTETWLAAKTAQVTL